MFLAPLLLFKGLWAPGRPVAKRLARLLWIPNEEQTVPALELRIQVPPTPSLPEHTTCQEATFSLASGQSAVVRPRVVKALLLSPPVHPYFWIWAVWTEEISWASHRPCTQRTHPLSILHSKALFHSQRRRWAGLSTSQKGSCRREGRREFSMRAPFIAPLFSKSWHVSSCVMGS